jgi:hypothetical protein
VSVPHSTPSRVTREAPLPGASFADAADLAHDLAQIAGESGDRRLAKLATDALTLADGLWAFWELLARIVEPPRSEP